MYHFFDWLSIQHISFDKSYNFRHFKVSYEDTRIILLLLTLNTFHTSFEGLMVGELLNEILLNKTVQSISTPMYYVLSTEIL